MPRKARTPLSQPIFGEPVFNEPVITPDPSGFTVPHPSDNQLFGQISNLLTKDVVGFDPARGKPGDLYTLAQALGPHGPEIVNGIQGNGKIVFHSAGDTGASNSQRLGNEVSVADQVTEDIHSAQTVDRPAFFYHLGDVVYNFGESKFYFDQFYDPYRNYPAPILALAGNHDSFIVPGTPAAQNPLAIFTRNFCAAAPGITPEAGSLHRTAMTQPGVYFTLDAPFVRIIGLFSNALEDPGVISSQGGKFAAVPDLQLAYLTAQLQRVKDEKYKGAVLLAVHHPPFSYSPAPQKPGSGGNHSSSTDMLREIDTVCSKVGVYPHAFLSGHAHNYQRYTRTVHFGGQDFDVPFVVCGDGGHNVNFLVQARAGQPPRDPTNGSVVSYLEQKPAVDARGLLLERFDDRNFGYLRVSVDKAQLRIGFHQVSTGSLAQSLADMVTVDLASHTMVSN